MVTFILCHEIAHIQLGHLDKSQDPEHEFEADYLALELYERLLNFPKKEGYLAFNSKLLCIPIVLMNYFSILEKYRFKKSNETPSRKTHPNPIDRSENLWDVIKKRNNSEAEYLLKLCSWD